MSEDSSLQQLPPYVNGLRTRGGLSFSQQPVHKLLAHKTLLEAGQVILPVLDEVGAIP